MSEAPTTHHCAAIIVAAGSSQRMGFDKLAAELNGKPVLLRTVEAFIEASTVEAIVVVCSEERFKLLDGIEFSKPVIRADGGKERQDSVSNGMDAIPEGVKHVTVHDGARPLISPSDIDRCVAAAEKDGAASLARRVTETVKRSDDDDYCKESVSRDHLWCMETPQTFKASLLRKAYQKVKEERLDVTDEVSALESISVRTRFIESQYPNLKITTPADLALASALLDSSDHE